MSLKILGFEASNGECSAAILEDMRLIYTIKSQDRSMQAESLIPMIEYMLAETKLGYSDIDYVATTTGPGSFTAIRIGLAAAKGIALASQINLLGLSNFDTIFYRTREQIGSYDYIAAILNAYRGQSYLQIFAKNGDIVQEGILIDNGEIANYLDLGGSIICAGQISQLKEFLTKLSVTILPRFPLPDARTVCKAAYEKIALGKAAGKLDPLYIRPPDAKIKQRQVL